MQNDIVPELLAAIDQYFIETNANSKELKRLVELQKNGKADYKEANELAIEIGKNMSKALKKYVTAESLPDEKFYFNIADRLINTSLKTNFDIVSGYSLDVQKSLNEQANLHLKAQVPEFNQEKAKGLVEKLVHAENFDDVAWLLDEPIVTFTQSIVDDSIQKNIEFHSKAGLRPRITRTLVGKGCKWCRNLAGSYQYPDDVPEAVYHRHERCRCIVNYHPGDGKRQDVWSKKWKDPDKDDKIKIRQALNKKVSIEIDELTNCLRDTKTGKLLETSYKPITISKVKAKSLQNQGWNFDWSSTKGQVYKLALKGSNEIQGLVSFSKDVGFNWLDLVESAPNNIGVNKKYSGVGPHLFAIAAKDSFENGNDGFVSFTPKTNLRKYYIDSLGAKDMPNGNQYLDSSASMKLVTKYFKNWRNG